MNNIADWIFKVWRGDLQFLHDRHKICGDCLESKPVMPYWFKNKTVVKRYLCCECVGKFQQKCGGLAHKLQKLLEDYEGNKS